jgi:TRAP transporter 4TM/12TM fusion protein
MEGLPMKAQEDNPENALARETKRDVKGFWKHYIFWVGVAMALFHIYALAISPLTHWSLYCCHVLFALLLIFPLYRAFGNSARSSVPWYDILLASCGIFAIVYCLLNREGMAYRMGSLPTSMDLLCIGIIMVLLLEGTRRIYGPILPMIAIIFLLYAHYGKYISGPLGHRGYTWKKTISYMLSYEAIFSSPMNASATMVFLFIVFGAFLTMSGAGPFFIDLAMSIAGGKRGGPAKVAVISSALFGTVSGNSVANVVSTGSFTIPLMKSVGYNPTFAAAVEATASSGGQIMPPILGSAAFIMAQLISVPYFDIMKAALIPALLYFFTVFTIVDIEAAKNGLKGIEKDKLPTGKYVLQNLYMILPLVVLTIVLTVLAQSTIRAALYGMASAIFIYVLKNKKLNAPLIVRTLSEGSKSACGMICACGTAGIVIGVLNMTGAGIKFASFVFELANEKLLPALFLTMVASLILGMGLPTSASYIICAAVAAPALIELGLSYMQAHMFVFYFACISAITPPVALAAYAGAGISGSKPMDVGFTACKLGICAFIVPYMFCYAPSLLWVGSLLEITVTIITAVLGATLLAYGLQRYVGLLDAQLNLGEAALFVVCALLLILPGITTDVIGIAGGGLLLSFKYFRKKKLETGER